MEPSRLPSATVSNGRTSAGRFGKGNKFSLGNPHSRRVAQLRSAIFAAVTEKDLRELMRSLLANAMQGDTAAAKLVLAYAVGAPQSMEEMRTEDEAAEKDGKNAILGLMPTEFLMAIARGDAPPKLVVQRE